MLTSSLSGWVAPDEEKASQENHGSPFKPSSSSLFQHPLVPERWVLPGQMFPPAQGARGQPCPPAEEDKWLLRKRSQAQVKTDHLLISCFPTDFLCSNRVFPASRV